MQRRVLYAAFCASLTFAGCGSGGDGPRGGAAAGSAGTAGSASALAGTGGSLATAAGSSAGGAAGMTSGGTATSMAGGGAASSGGAGGGSNAGSGGSAGGPAKQSGTPLVYIGGFGDFPVRTYELNKTTGALTQRGNGEAAGKSPSYLALHPSAPYLYNVNEETGGGAGVTAHHVKADGTLEPLNHQQGTDDSPGSCNGSCGFTHLAVAPNGKLLMAASYDGGSVSVFPINADGTLGAEKQKLDFGNQAEAHSVGFDPLGQFAWVPTLGLDRVQQLKLSADGGLSKNTPSDVQSAQNAGPRHIAVHANGKLAFVINETASTMTPYAVSTDGKLTAGNTVSTLPQGATGETYGQHVELSPDGRFLYGSNVGHDSIAVFAVDQASGALTWLQDQPSGGMWPRDFDVDPNGEVLVVANRDSSNLAVFKIGGDGKLTPLGQPQKVPDQPTGVVIRYQQ